MEGLEFDPKGVKKHGLVYTDLSRVKHIECLYLLNKLEESNFCICPKVAIEMERMQKNSPLQF